MRSSPDWVSMDCSVVLESPSFPQINTSGSSKPGGMDRSGPYPDLPASGSMNRRIEPSSTASSATQGFATPPLLKSVDGTRFGGPTGIFTRRDQHVCYSMDHMASSVETFNPLRGHSSSTETALRFSIPVRPS